MFWPGHRFLPICASKRSHLIFSGLCDLPELVIGHLHFQDFGCRKSFSNCVCLAVQSEHTIFVRPLDSVYLRRASYGNFKCPRSPHSSQRYFLMSFGDIPLLQQTAQTRFLPCFLACANRFLSKAASSSCSWQASHVHRSGSFRHFRHAVEVPSNAWISSSRLHSLHVWQLVHRRK